MKFFPLDLILGILFLMLAIILGWQYLQAAHAKRQLAKRLAKEKIIDEIAAANQRHRTHIRALRESNAKK